MPSGVDAEAAALAEPLVCSIHGFQKINLRGHQTVFIVGAGTIGLTAILAARALGARVIVQARHSHQRAAAMRFGASEVLSEDDAGRNRLNELLKSDAIDAAVEMVGGKGDTLWQAQSVVRAKGKVLVLGVFSGGMANINPLHLALKEIELIGSMTYATHEGRVDYQIALDVISENVALAKSLVTHRFGLSQVDAAFRTAMDKSTESIKVHITPYSLV